MTTKRKTISKKTRFEVFKRDSFTCQYCGKQAPNVVLHIDHISPVSKGGKNEILNLITSCLDCNSGKGARELSDDTAILKQRAQLEELNERRDQLEMMLKWRDGMKEIKSTEIEYLKALWENSIGNSFSLNEQGINDLKKLARKYPMTEIADAIETSAEQYITFDKDGVPTRESVETCFRKVSGILRVRNMDDDTKELYYIRGICRNRFSYVNERECLEMLKAIIPCGGEIDVLKAIARDARNWTQWVKAMDTYMDDLNG